MTPHEDQAALVPSLLAMTVVTGVVDAVSILRLGHVFVANMTGNVVFLGFAVAGASGFSAAASLAAVGAFLIGAAIAARSMAGTQRVALGRVAAVEAALCVMATAVAALSSGTESRYAITVLLGLAMGGQNAAARKLAVPDLTTTVLTLTLTGLVADAPDLGRTASHTVRRAAAVVAMLAGATGGALLVQHASTGWALGIAAAILVAIALRAGWSGPGRCQPAVGGSES